MQQIGKGGVDEDSHPSVLQSARYRVGPRKQSSQSIEALLLSFSCSFHVSCPYIDEDHYSGREISNWRIFRKFDVRLWKSHLPLSTEVSWLYQTDHYLQVCRCVKRETSIRTVCEDGLEEAKSEVTGTRRTRPINPEAWVRNRTLL